jgi:ubiquitin C-terminal hydrolase
MMAIWRYIREKKMDQFEPNKQHDACEFLVFLIDIFHTALARKVKFSSPDASASSLKTRSKSKSMSKSKEATQCFEMMKKTYSNDYSEMVTMFHGILVSEIIDNKTTIKTVYEPFFVLDLPIPLDNCVLADCLNMYVREERMEGDNAWTDDATGAKRDVNRRIRFWTFPNILVIALKRFTNVSVKLNTYVEFPETLDVSPYLTTTGSSGSNESVESKSTYSLYAVCNHTGRAKGGHYTASIKVGSSSSSSSSSWYLFDDETVTRIPRAEYVVNSSAYILFYAKCEK